jgi:hypothetical protein
MEDKELAQKWPKIKDKLLQEYPHLTPEELRYEIGKEGELLKQLQTKLGKNKQEIDNWLALMG